MPPGEQPGPPPDPVHSAPHNTTQHNCCVTQHTAPCLRRKLIEQKTTEMANSDLDKYHKALEKALLHFHTTKMADINKLVKELWQKTYRGQVGGGGWRSGSAMVCCVGAPQCSVRCAVQCVLLLLMAQSRSAGANSTPTPTPTPTPTQLPGAHVSNCLCPTASGHRLHPDQGGRGRAALVQLPRGDVQRRGGAGHEGALLGGPEGGGQGCMCSQHSAAVLDCRASGGGIAFTGCQT
jgi:hypothetical protein